MSKNHFRRYISIYIYIKEKRKNTSWRIDLAKITKCNRLPFFGPYPNWTPPGLLRGSHKTIYIDRVLSEYLLQDGDKEYENVICENKHILRTDCAWFGEEEEEKTVKKVKQIKYARVIYSGHQGCLAGQIVLQCYRKKKNPAGFRLRVTFKHENNKGR